jgi:copper chaperone
MLKSLSLKVTGDQRLNCVSCEQRVVRVLNTLTGIQQVSADAKSQRIDVMFNSAELEQSAIVDRLGLLGYTTETVE